MNEKKQARMRRARSSRMKMRELGATRLSVHRTPRHIYAQIIAPEGDTRAGNRVDARCGSAQGRRTPATKTLRPRSVR